MSFLPYSKVNCITGDKILHLIVIQKIRNDAYICVEEKEEVSLVILFRRQIKNRWSIVCNLGKFRCDPDRDRDTFGVTIPNTEWIPLRPDINVRLFEKQFSHPNFESYDRLNEDLLTPGMNRKSNELFDTFEEMAALSGDITEEQNPFAYDLLKFSSMTLKRILFNLNLNSRFNVMEEFFRSYPSPEYLQSQIEFSLHTSLQERYYLKIYSYKGDNVINSYIRNSFRLTDATMNYINQNEEVFPDYVHNADYEIMQSFVKEFYDVLKTLFARAPENPREFMVYRGSRTKDHFDGTVDNIYVDRGFVSTSIDLNVAMKFSQDSYVSFIHIPKGARVIFNWLYTVFPEELEFILNDSTYYLVTKEFQPLRYISENMSYTASEIHKYFFNINTNELVVLQN